MSNKGVESKDPGVVDLDRVAAIMREQGVAAAVSHSGGNTATIFFGPADRFAAGLGWFESDDYSDARASLDELTYGPTDGDIGDLSEFSGRITDGNEETIAALLVDVTLRFSARNDQNVGEAEAS